MLDPSRRPFVPRAGAPARRRLLLSLPGTVLALAVIAAPAQAAPDDPPGRSGDAPSRTGPLPAPDHAAAHEAVNRQGPPAGAPRPQGPPAGVPQGPPEGVPQGPPAGVPDVAPGPGDTDGAPPVTGTPAAGAGRGQKVVVCKYVRKPGVAEVFSHIIVVNENALLGKGFAGTFPFAFSDAHVKSVAVRYAARGERASEISVSTCSADTPPGEEPPGEEPQGEEPPDEVGGIVEDAGPGVAQGQDAAGLPATGAADHLLLAALLGGVGTLGGGWLALRGRRPAVR